MSDLKCDCLVIGAGPAGAASAALVAAEGFDTMLVEREAVPRPHVGESLMPETFGTLKRLGLIDHLMQSRFPRKVGVQFVDSTGRESQPFFFRDHDKSDSATTWHVERSEFDRMLFENARRLGANCLDRTRVARLVLRPESPHLAILRRGNNREIHVTARVVIDATGQQALIANQLQLQIPNQQLRKAAIWGHFKQPPEQHRDEAVTTILHTGGKRAWFWHIPIAHDRVSVGLVSDSERLFASRRDASDVFHAAWQGCPGLQARLPRLDPVGALRVAREFSYTTKEHAGAGWVLVGDALGFIDPIYSTGVFLALRSGELAADCVVRGLATDDLSRKTLGSWHDDFQRGVRLFRRLVNAFYTPEFSFADFLRRYPEHQGNLTDLLIGRAFHEGADAIFADLEPELESLRAAALVQG